MSIPTKAISKCTVLIISNGIFHRNINIPNNILQQLRTLNSPKDSEKEEWTWKHLPLWLQTTSQSCSNHNSEGLAQTQAQGLEERIESPGIKPHVCGQFMKIKPGTCKEERTVLSRNSDRKLATYTKEHHWASSRSSNRNLTKNSPFCTWSSPLPPTPRVVWDGPPVSAQLDTGNVYFILIFPSCSASLLVGIEATPRPLSLDAAPLSRSPNPDGAEETKLPPAGHRAESEGTRPVPTGQRRGWRPTQATREEQAAPRS